MMKVGNFVPLHVHSDASILDGLPKPKKLASKCAELGYKACAITNHGVITDAVDFSKSMKAEGIKPILGIEFYLSGLDATIKTEANNMCNISHLLLLAKNRNGWQNLIKLVSRSNDDDVYYYRPRLDIHRLADYCDDLIAFSGHTGSELGNSIFYPRSSEIRADAYEVAKATAKQYMDIFGRDRFFVEIQLIDKWMSPKQELIGDVLRKVAKDLDLKCIATGDTHYVNKEDWLDHHVLLASNMKTTLPKIRKELADGRDVGFSTFFQSNNYNLPTLEELQKVNTEEEIENTSLIASMCEDYSLTNKPMLPQFKWTEGMSEEEYLRHLCREGWKSKYKTGWDKQIYGDRVKKELSVLREANLEGYFLIIRDMIHHARSQGWFTAVRGSATGSLVAYLSGITGIDPIPYDLVFERFYNAGRNTKDHVSYPDIDIDFPAAKREQMFEYIREKYGEQYTARIMTLGRMQGAGALKTVLSVHEACSPQEMNEITKGIPDESKINDQMEDQGIDSVLQFVLENMPDITKDYCRIEDDGTLSGEYAQYFEQAIRLEGTYKSQGKHAAGAVIGNQPVGDICPMVRDPNGEHKLAGFTMFDLELVGLIKFDCLSLACLDKLMGVNNLLEHGKIHI